MSHDDLKRRILQSQRNRKQVLVDPAKVDPWYIKFRDVHSKQIGLDASKYKSPVIVPFGYKSWEALCQDIDKYHREVMNIFENIRTPGTLKKPIFYKFRNADPNPTLASDKPVTTMVRIHNIGTPIVSVIECAINGDAEAVKEVCEIMQFGKTLNLTYLYSEAQDPKSMMRVKMRTVDKPTIDMIKMRMIWLYRAGFGVSFRDATTMAPVTNVEGEAQ